MIEPLQPRLEGYFHFFGVKGALLLQLGRRPRQRKAFDRAIALGAHHRQRRRHIRQHLEPADEGLAHRSERASA
jgi:RNA polymerase sigma-70 factor (ECF subfamily)